MYREHDLQGRFEIVLVFSSRERLSPTQNLTMTSNSMSSLDVKRILKSWPLNAAAK